MLDFTVKPVSGRLSMSHGAANSLRNNILLSLHIKRGSIITQPSFGSDLHTIKTLSDSNVALAKVLAENALKWLVEKQRVKTISVAVSVHENTLVIGVTVERKAEPPRYCETYFRVA